MIVVCCHEVFFSVFLWSWTYICVTILLHLSRYSLSPSGLICYSLYRKWRKPEIVTPWYWTVHLWTPCCRTTPRMFFWNFRGTKLILVNRKVYSSLKCSWTTGYARRFTSTVYFADLARGNWCTALNIHWTPNSLTSVQTCTVSAKVTFVCETKEIEPVCSYKFSRLVMVWVASVNGAGVGEAKNARKKILSQSPRPSPLSLPVSPALRLLRRLVLL